MADTRLTARVDTRVDAKTAAGLVKTAAAQRRTVSDVARIALEEYLQRQGGKK
jgi:hypothetical protein